MQAWPDNIVNFLPIVSARIPQNIMKDIMEICIMLTRKINNTNRNYTK